jgi:outer membrane protein assembly factor BamB
MSARTVAIAALLLAAPAATGDDWPQWMGPKRDNVWREQGVVDTLPASPKVLWRVPVAGGFAGPAVSGGKIYVADYVTKADTQTENFERDKEFSGNERVLCLDEKTGQQIWKHEYPVKYTISFPAGPRCTPNVHGGKVYTLGAEGDLVCLDANTGKPVWAKNLKTEYKTQSPLWGYAAHPLIDGQKLITLAGGDGSHVVALDKDTGRELWKAGTQKQTGYSPPVIIEAGGTRQLIVTGATAVVSLDPETGKRHWTQPLSTDNACVIMTPLKVGDFLYVGAWSNKNLLLKLAADKPAAEVVWRDKKGHGISPVNVQPAVENGVVYGYDQDGELMAAELASGKRLWVTEGPIGTKLDSGTAFMIKHGDRYWFFTETGDLVIAKLTPKGYEELSRTKVLAPSYTAYGRTVVWCQPAFANKHIYIRNTKELVCIDVSK